MQSMISMKEGDNVFRVFFDLDNNTKEFVNVNIRKNGESFQVDDDFMERVKDTLALEYQYTMFTLVQMVKNGMKPILC